MISIGEMIIRITTQDETKIGLDSAKQNVRSGMQDVQTSVVTTSKEASRSVRDMAKSISAAGLSVAAIGGSLTTVAVGLQNLGVMSDTASRSVTAFSMAMLVLGGVVSTVSTVTRAYSTFLASKFVADLYAAAAAATTLQIALGVVGIAAVAIAAVMVYLHSQSARAGRSFEDLATDAKTSAQALSLLDAVLSSIQYQIQRVDEGVASFDKKIDDSKTKVRDLESAIRDWNEALQLIDQYNRDASDLELQTQYDRLALAEEILDVRENETGIVDEAGRKAIQIARDQLDVVRARKKLDEDIAEPKNIADKIAEQEQRILDIKKEFGVESLTQLKDQLDAENKVVEQAYADRAEIISKRAPLAKKEEEAQVLAETYRAYTQIGEWEKAGIPMTAEQKQTLSALPGYEAAFEMRAKEYEAAMEKEPSWLTRLEQILWLAFPTPLKTPEVEPKEPAYMTLQQNIENVYLTDPKQVEELQRIMENAFVVALNNSGVNQS